MCAASVFTHWLKLLTFWLHMGERFSVKSYVPSHVSLLWTTKPQKHCYRLFLRYQMCQFSVSMCTVTLWMPNMISRFYMLMLTPSYLSFLVSLSLILSQSIIAAVILLAGTATPSTVACWSTRTQTAKPGRRLTSRTCHGRITRPCSVSLSPNPSLSRRKGKVIAFFLYVAFLFFISSLLLSILLSQVSFFLIYILHFSDTFSLFYPFLVVHPFVLFLSLFSSSFIISMSLILFLPLLRFVLPLPHILSNLLLCWLSVLFPSLFPSALYQSPVSCPPFITTHLFLSSHPLAVTN